MKRCLFKKNGLENMEEREHVCLYVLLIKLSSNPWKKIAGRINRKTTNTNKNKNKQTKSRTPTNSKTQTHNKSAPDYPVVAVFAFVFVDVHLRLPWRVQLQVKRNQTWACLFREERGKKGGGRKVCGSFLKFCMHNHRERKSEGEVKGQESQPGKHEL